MGTENKEVFDLNEYENFIKALIGRLNVIWISKYYLFVQQWILKIGFKHITSTNIHRNDSRTQRICTTTSLIDESITTV